MNKVLMSLLFGAFILTGQSFAQTPPATPPAEVPAVAATETVKPAHHEHEHRSEIRKAVNKLRTIKHELEKNTHEYGGHKAKAIEAINHAIEELSDALDAEKK